jgi:DNA-binding transcriptional ArsR family regulator
VAKRKASASSAAAAVRRSSTPVPEIPEPTPLTVITGNATSPLALDRLIHERVRLAIVSSLAVHDMLSFNDLKALLDTTDGNLSVHARKLEEAHYITCTKGYDGRIPRTEYRLTATGRAALETYLAHMEALIRRVGDAG